jgi:cardiolipin synthase
MPALELTAPLLGSLYYASEWAIRIAMVVYVPQRRPPAAARSWLLLILFLPWPGLVLYAIFGRVYFPRRRIEMQEKVAALIRSTRDRLLGAGAAGHPALPPQFEPAIRLAENLGDFPPAAGNRFELLGDYDGTIDRLIADIDAATDHAHLLFYIFEDDRTGRRVAAALVRAAARGVTCRLLMDSLGSKGARHRLAPELRAAGVEVIELMRVRWFRRNAARFDLRNHRKIVVIDGRIGYTGSQNIVDAEANAGMTNEELVVRVTGPVVHQLQVLLLADRYLETGDAAQQPGWFPPAVAAGSSPAQVLGSGPGYRHGQVDHLLITLIQAATRRIVLTTPYFVPDTSFLLALRLAVERGVEVHLVVSKRSNQRLANLAQQSFYDELLDAGVRIHLYRRNFLHAKHSSFDDGVALIGSSNLDIRSFALNSEVSMLIYDPQVVAQLRAVQERYFADADTLDAAAWAARPASHRILQNMGRLTDSFL